MNKEQIKQLVFDNFTSNELYKLSVELSKLQRQKEIDQKPTLEALFEICKQKFIIGSYIKIEKQKHNVGWGSEFCSDIFNNNERDFDVVYAKINDLKISEYEDEDGENNRIILYYDFCQICNSSYEDIENLESVSWINYSKGIGKLILVWDSDRKLNEFEFEVITEQEYNRQIELCNKIYKNEHYKRSKVS